MCLSSGPYSQKHLPIPLMRLPNVAKCLVVNDLAVMRWRRRNHKRLGHVLHQRYDLGDGSCWLLTIMTRWWVHKPPNEPGLLRWCFMLWVKSPGYQQSRDLCLLFEIFLQHAFWGSMILTHMLEIHKALKLCGSRSWSLSHRIWMCKTQVGLDIIFRCQGYEPLVIPASPTSTSDWSLSVDLLACSWQISSNFSHSSMGDVRIYRILKPANLRMNCQDYKVGVIYIKDTKGWESLSHAPSTLRGSRSGLVFQENKEEFVPLT